MNARQSRGGGAAISARGLAKSYGKVRAVREVDLDVGRGEIYGFLGRNGAGKTTTIRMLLGLIRPSAGDVAIFGESVERRRHEALKEVGFLVESASAYPNLTARENLELQRRLKGAPRGSVEQALGLTGLEGFADRRSGRLSLGNKQRLSLARAMLGSPGLLILDEPANGLDPAGIVEVRSLLRSLADSGVTVFMSSHILAEVDQLADRIGIIHEGVLVEELGRDQLRSRRRLRVELTVDQPEKARALLSEGLGLAGVERDGERSLRVSDAGADCARIARELVGAGIGLERLFPVEENLEERFMRVTGGEK
jgi:ABC-2 type transport system ATP-binding protein